MVLEATMQYLRIQYRGSRSSHAVLTNTIRWSPKNPCSTYKLLIQYRGPQSSHAVLTNPISWSLKQPSITYEYNIMVPEVAVHYLRIQYRGPGNWSRAVLQSREQGSCRWQDCYWSGQSCPLWQPENKYRNEIIKLIIILFQLTHEAHNSMCWPSSAMTTSFKIPVYNTCTLL